MANEKKTKVTKKVEQSGQIPSLDEPGFGWTRYSEQVNGRFAMIGFVALLVLEVLTNQGIFTWLGLR